VFGITVETAWMTKAWAGALFVLFLNTAAYSGRDLLRRAEVNPQGRS
jgi:polar amino acid transport system permease protein